MQPQYSQPQFSSSVAFSGGNNATGPRGRGITASRQSALENRHFRQDGSGFGLGFGLGFGSSGSYLGAQAALPYSKDNGFEEANPAQDELAGRLGRSWREFGLSDKSKRHLLQMTNGSTHGMLHSQRQHNHNNNNNDGTGNPQHQRRDHMMTEGHHIRQQQHGVNSGSIGQRQQPPPPPPPTMAHPSSLEASHMTTMLGRDNYTGHLDPSHSASSNSSSSSSNVMVPSPPVTSGVPGSASSTTSTSSGGKRKSNNSAALATLSSLASIAGDNDESSPTGRKKPRRQAQTESKGMSLDQHIVFYDLIAKELTMNRRAERDWGKLYHEGGQNFRSWWFEAFPSVSLYKQKGKLLFGERRGRVQLGFWKSLVKRKDMARPSESLVDIVASELEKKANAFPVPNDDSSVPPHMARSEPGINPWSFNVEAAFLTDRLIRGEKGPGSILDWPETPRRAVLSKILKLHRSYGDGFEGVSKHFNHLIVQAEVELAVLSICDCRSCKAWEVGAARGRAPELRLLWSRRRAALVRSVLELHKRFPDDEVKVAILARQQHIEFEPWRDDTIIALLKASHSHTTCNVCLASSAAGIAPLLTSVAGTNMLGHDIHASEHLMSSSHGEVSRLGEDNHSTNQLQQHMPMETSLHAPMRATPHNNHQRHTMGDQQQHQQYYHHHQQHHLMNQTHMHAENNSPSYHSRELQDTYISLVTQNGENNIQILVSQDPASGGTSALRLRYGSRVAFRYNQKLVEQQWTGSSIVANFDPQVTFPEPDRILVSIDGVPKMHIVFDGVKTPQLGANNEHVSFVGLFGYPHGMMRELRAVLYSTMDAQQVLGAQMAEGRALLARSIPLHLDQGTHVHLRWISVLEEQQLVPVNRDAALVAGSPDASVALFPFSTPNMPLHGPNRITLQVYHGRGQDSDTLEIVIDPTMGKPFGFINTRMTLLPPRNPHIVIGCLPEHDVWAKSVEYNLRMAYGYDVSSRGASRNRLLGVSEDIHNACIFICLAPVVGTASQLFGFHEHEMRYICNAFEQNSALVIMLHSHLDLERELSSPEFSFPSLRRAPAFACHIDTINNAVSEAHAYIQRSLLNAHEHGPRLEFSSEN